jgi:hypothetical protein
MSRDHLITTPPTLTVCGTCHTPVLAALVGGLERHVDTAALTPDGELQALRHGLATFELRGEVLARRSVEHIRAGATGAVLAEHSHHPIPDRFVDGSRMAAAIGLVVRLLGATPVAAEANDAPPPF